MSEEEKQDQGFRVSDRRRFAGSESGEAPQEEKAPEGDKKPPESQEAAGEKPDAAGQEGAAKKPEAEKQSGGAHCPSGDQFRNLCGFPQQLRPDSTWESPRTR